MGNAFQKNPKFDNEADDTSEHDTDLLLECVSFQCKRKKKIDPEAEAIRARKRESLQRVQKENEDRARHLREQAQQRRLQELERQRKEIEEENRQKREGVSRRKEESTESSIGIFDCFKSREKTPNELAEEEKKRKEKDLAKQQKREEKERKQLEKERAKAEKEKKALIVKEIKQKEKDEAAKLKAMEKERKSSERNEADRLKMQQVREKQAEKERRRRDMKESNSISSIEFFPCLKRREKSPAELAAEENMHKQKEEAERLRSTEREKKRLEKVQAEEREREERKLRENEIRMQAERQREKEEAEKREREERKLKENEIRAQSERQREKEEQEKQSKLREMENNAEAEKRRVEEYQRQLFERNKLNKRESEKPIYNKEKRPKGVAASESDNSSLHESDLELKWCGTLKKPKKKRITTEDEKTESRVKEQQLPKKESKAEPESKIKPEPEPAEVFVKTKAEPVLEPIKETLSEIKIEPKAAEKIQSSVPAPVQCPPCPTIEVVEKRIQEAQTEPLKCLQPVEMKDNATLVTPSLSLEGKDMHKDGLDKKENQEPIDENLLKTSFKPSERDKALESQKETLDKSKEMIKKTTEDSSVQTDDNLLENLLGLNIKNQTTGHDAVHTKLEIEKEKPLGNSSTQTDEDLIKIPLGLQIKEEPVERSKASDGLKKEFQECKNDLDKSEKNARRSTGEPSGQEEDKTSFEFLCSEYLKNDIDYKHMRRDDSGKGTSSTKKTTTSSAQTDVNLLETPLRVKIKDEPIDSDTARKNLEKEIEALERTLNIKKEVTYKQERSNEENKPNISTHVDAITQTDDTTQIEVQQRLRGDEATTTKIIYMRDQGNQTEPWRFGYYDSSEKIITPYCQASGLGTNKKNTLPEVSNVSEGTQTDCMCDCFVQTSATEREAILHTNARKIIKHSLSTQTEICTCNFDESSLSSYLSTECLSRD